MSRPKQDNRKARPKIAGRKFDVMSTWQDYVKLDYVNNTGVRRTIVLCSQQ